ncbi:unnamed protein product [Lactuca virosa]|uniref:Uncharacterized protein n=1 Tax=Lactuca virosa TaxID=75947 RepID=A0AAU9LIA9_9ASTR|nr:unnamed protein product [Lactuca virosa]
MPDEPIRRGGGGGATCRCYPLGFKVFVAIEKGGSGDGYLTVGVGVETATKWRQVVAVGGDGGSDGLLLFRFGLLVDGTASGDESSICYI